MIRHDRDTVTLTIEPDLSAFRRSFLELSARRMGWHDLADVIPALAVRPAGTPMKGHLRYLAWWARLALVDRTYRLCRRLLAVVHAPGDPLCRRARSAAVAHPRGHGLECAPCAGQRRADALWGQLLGGRR